MKNFLSLILICIIISFQCNKLFALTIGNYGTPASYGCSHSSNHQCWISDDAYYQDYAYYAIMSPPGPVIIQEIIGCDSTTYFYIPEPDQYTGRGVINGYMQYFKNDPNAIVRTYTDSNSITYTNYAVWKRALENMGITPPNPY